MPTWNEEAGITACLRSVGVDQPGVEVIVIDGGSTDRTADIADGFGVRVLVSPVRQRAAQLNLGAREARGEVLLFLHADTQLPGNWREELARLLGANPRIMGGGFRRRFDHPSPWLRFTCILADWRGRLGGCFLGDQAMFIRAEVFRSLGGFRPVDRCEDLDLSLRLIRVGRTGIVTTPVLSSGRRFLNRGPFRQTWTDLVAVWRFLRNPPAADASAAPPSGRSDPASPR